jgi:hypothetical protein
MRYTLIMADQTEPKDQRVVMMMTRSELKAVDDWRFAWRISSRGEAMRQLVALGLELAAERKAKGVRLKKKEASE